MLRMERFPHLQTGTDEKDMEERNEWRRQVDASAEQESTTEDELEISAEVQVENRVIHVSA